MDDAKRKNEPGLSVNRRQLVVGGAALATLPLLVRAAAAHAAVADAALLAATAPGRAADARAAAATATSPLSIGFLDGSDQLADLRVVRADLRITGDVVGAGLGAGYGVVPATDLVTGEPAFAEQPVRIAILGLYPREPRGGGPLSIDFDVEHTADDLPPGKTVRYFAWSYRRKPRNVSAPVRFTVTPTWQGSLAFDLSIVGPQGGAPQLQRSQFTLADDAGRPRLQRGIYLVALNGRPWDGSTALPATPAGATLSLLSLVVAVDPVAAAR